MKLINHTYTSLDECLHAMIDGVEFRHKTTIIRYKPLSSQFVVANEFGEQLLMSHKLYWQEWQVQAEPDWRDDLPKGKRIPCEAWDDDVVEKRFDFIHSYVDGDCYPYKGTVDDYTHATPIQEKDCWRAE